MRTFRRWYWRSLRRYPGEICELCGRPVATTTGPTWWWAPDDVWRRVVDPTIEVLCIPCFATQAVHHNYCVSWFAVPEGDR